MIISHIPTINVKSYERIIILVLEVNKIYSSRQRGFWDLDKSNKTRVCKR